MNNPYAILGLTAYATEQEIKEAYRRLSSEHHPDKTGGDDTIQQALNAAYAHFKEHGAKNPPNGANNANAFNRAENVWGAGAHAFWRNQKTSGGRAAPKEQPQPPNPKEHTKDTINTIDYGRVVLTHFCPKCAGSGRMRLASGYQTKLLDCIFCNGLGITKNHVHLYAR